MPLEALSTRHVRNLDAAEASPVHRQNVPRSTGRVVSVRACVKYEIDIVGANGLDAVP